MNELISLKSVSKEFGKKLILDDINLRILPGTFTALIGCNGAGKSTLLRIIAGLEGRSGSVSFQGTDPNSLRSKLGPEIFLIHENLPLYSPIKLSRFITVYKEVFPHWDDTYFNQLVRERRLDLNSFFSALSRGQKTQFFLCMALASQAKAILCDEVTSMLDFDAQFFFLEELKKFVLKGGTVIMTTNILSEMEEYADHVILLQGKKILIDQKVSDLSERFKIIVKSSPHDIFERDDVVAVRPRDGRSNLYLATHDTVAAHNLGPEFHADVKPKLEDFLLLSFKKEKLANENLVA